MTEQEKLEKIIQLMEEYRDNVTIQARPFVKYCISIVRSVMSDD